MKIKFFCPRWGFEKIPWKKFLADVKAAGYAGIEWFPVEKKERKEALQLLHEFDLEFCIVTAVAYPKTFEKYLSVFKDLLLDMSSVKTDDVIPLHITAHTGREFFNEEQIEKCLAICDEVTRNSGILIYQETHRNKWAYAAHATLPVLKKHPGLPLTFDVSHWFCVSESYLEDQQEAVEMAIQHARHIHARVGHIEGPQVYDPALPEFAEALQQHLTIWDKYILLRKKQDAESCTITPEFGPPPYMVFAGREGTPEEEQWRVNLWMKNFLEKRYSEL